MKPLALLAFAACLLGAAPPREDPSALVRAAAGYEYGQDRAPLDAVEHLIRASSGDAARMARLESALIGLLRGEAAPAAKDFACRQLSLIGGAASVPVLAALLNDPALGSIALYALERIPGKLSAAALARALASAGGPTRIGLVSAMTRRGISSPSYKQWLTDPDPRLAAAAAAAIASTGGSADAAALLKARRANPAAGDAALRLAGRLGARGRPIYQELLATQEPPMTRLAALEGLARLDGANALPAVLNQLEAAEPSLRRAAIRLAARLGAHAPLIGALAAQPPALQVVTITALSEAAAPAALPVFRQAAAAPDAEVRIAAIRALERHGGAAEVSLLAAIASKAEEPERDEARLALARLRGAEADAAIVKLLADSEGALKLELIRAAAERGCAEAAPWLLESARSADRELRRESYRALRELAPAGALPQLAALLAAAPSAADRRELERALSSTLRRHPEAPLAPLDRDLSAAPSAEARASWIAALGQSGRADALPALRSALKQAEAALRRAAILALTGWPSPAAAPDLLDSARSDPEPALRVLALRGYIRLVSLPAAQPAAETVRQLAEALQASPQPEEKKALLAALARFVCPEALAIARSLASDPDVASEANAAVEKLERSLPSRR